MRSIKEHLRKVIPDSVLALRRRYHGNKANKFLHRATRKEIFTRIYERAYWGQSGDRGEPYYSGPGSHSAESIDRYVAAVTTLLSSLDKKPDVVDLGCGDFAVGSRVRRYCGRYIACDIVEGLISRNKSKYAKDDVEFRVVDIVNDDLPEGDQARSFNICLTAILKTCSQRYRRNIAS
jgi:SAM-dependent methyltransferase